MESTPIYALRVADVYAALESSPGGLASEDAEARRSLYGFNTLAEPLKGPQWHRLAGYVLHPLAVMLILAGVLALVTGAFFLAPIIFAVVVVNAGFSFWREYRAEQAMEALRRLLPAYARVIREGAELQIPASEVVPGDVLVLAEGDNIPADARVVEEYGLRTNNATLTGEAVPARKSADASLREGISEVERPNLVFAGTSVVSGTAKAVVYAIGMLTEFGRIATLTQAVKEEPSPIQREILRINRRLALGALGIGVIVFVVGLLEVELSLYEAFLLALGIIVAAVPEGLPATITLSLAMAGQRLAQQGVFVKKLAVIETLGTVSMICTDKSGTLTQNQMTVRDIWVGRQRLSVSGVGYEPKGSFLPDPRNTPCEVDLEMLLTAATLCNNSRLNPPTLEHPGWTSLGDQTEVALRVAAIKGGLDEEQFNQVFKRIHELPFDARRKRMTTIHRAMQTEVAFVKGAPREVLQLCTSIQINGEIVPLTSELRSEILAANDDYSRNALRVLALARREFPQRQGSFTVERIERELTFLGLMAMMDPPRPEVEAAVKICRQAGIRMVMITGDYGLTAESLARRVGMLVTQNPTIVTGAELDAMSDFDLQALLPKEIIYARMAPEHKLRLVAAFQANGEVVAVTGDGVNDAPALRKANIGVVMGMTGTDVAKEAADVVLVNDNFSTIVSAIEEGRTVFGNLRKFITYIFSSNVAEVMPFIVTAMTGIPLALKVSQILAIDLGTDLLPALALGIEKPEPDVMHSPPRRLDSRLIDRGLLQRAFMWLGMIEAVLCYTGFFLVYYLVGGVDFLHMNLLDLGAVAAAMNQVPLQVQLIAVTVFHAGVVTAQVGNVFACRTETNRGRQLGWLSNRTLLRGVALELIIILCLVYVPGLNTIFDHVPLPWFYWIWLILYAPALYSLDWVRKAVIRWLRRS